MVARLAGLCGDSREARSRRPAKLRTRVPEPEIASRGIAKTAKQSTSGNPGDEGAPVSLASLASRPAHDYEEEDAVVGATAMRRSGQVAPFRLDRRRPGRFGRAWRPHSGRAAPPKRPAVGGPSRVQPAAFVPPSVLPASDGFTSPPVGRILSLRARSSNLRPSAGGGESSIGSARSLGAAKVGLAGVGGVLWRRWELASCDLLSLSGTYVMRIGQGPGSPHWAPPSGAARGASPPIASVMSVPRSSVTPPL